MGWIEMKGLGHATMPSKFFLLFLEIELRLQVQHHTISCI